MGCHGAWASRGKLDLGGQDRPLALVASDAGRAGGRFAEACGGAFPRGS